MTTRATKKCTTQLSSFAEAEAHYAAALHNTVREYLVSSDIEDHISAVASAFAMHVTDSIDEHEECFTMPVAEFKTQAYAYADLINFLCKLQKNHEHYTYYSTKAKAQAKTDK
jgi:hypothetical protein